MERLRKADADFKATVEDRQTTADDEPGAADALRTVARVGEVGLEIERAVGEAIRRMPDGRDVGHVRVRAIARYRDALAKATSLGSEVRLAQQNMANLVAANQLESSDRFRGAAESIAALLVGPGLLAALYGANVMLPARGTWAGFIGLVAMMLGAGLMTWWALDVHRRRRAGAQRAPRRPVRESLRSLWPSLRTAKEERSPAPDARPAPPRRPLALRVAFGFSPVVFLVGFVVAATTTPEKEDAVPEAPAQGVPRLVERVDAR
ncbi:MAG TPA: hypothetical protein VHF51_09975 [Solirubrobacteraceae bacterium]|nr:hypothetical protein [Solirubrobacteraceae bacterium]